MGLFDFFNKETKTTDTQNDVGPNFNFNQSIEENAVKKDAPIAPFSPTSFSDVEVIIDKLKEGKNVIVHVNQLKADTAKRVVDMLSGAIYALNGGVYEMEKDVFLFSPSGIEINQ